MIFKDEAENQLAKTIKVLRSNKGGEYTLNAMSSFYNQNGIVHKFIALYTLEPNGVTKRKKRILMDMVNAMLLSPGVPENLWGEALLSACFILNSIPFKDHSITPYELLKKEPHSSTTSKLVGV